jgi:Zn-dependent peptidase ImmA (M78 family)
MGNATFNYWRQLLESHGVLVFQTTGIVLEVFRGLSVHHDRLPFILLNGADSAGGKVFTLFHEVAHLGNRTSGLCLLEDAVADEALCNAFAAEFLMPAEAVRVLQRQAAETDDLVSLVSAHFRVSPLAAAVQLRRLDLITVVQLEEVRARSDDQWQRSRDRLRESESVPPRWRLRLRDLGPTYVSAVFRALERERVSLLDVTYLLDARVPTIERMLEEFHRTGGAA